MARLEPLPSSRGQGGDGGISGDTADDAWVEETKERAERGCVSTALAFLFNSLPPSLSLGSADAQFSLGQYHFAQGSYEAALQCFQAAEAKGNNQARYQLAVMLYDGLGTHQDPVR